VRRNQTIASHESAAPGDDAGRLPLSVAIVSGAEAHRIGRTLESVAGWTRELVVVLDDRARDGTAALVEQFGGRVFREPWKGFIGQKNSVAEKCGQPWILNLDADEVVSAPLREALRTLFADADRLAARAAYEFPRCTFYCGRWIRHGDWYPDRVRRLWRRGAARWVGEEPHARLEVTGRVGRLRADLLHYSNQSIADQIAKIAPYHADFVANRIRAGRGAGFFELVLRPWWRFLRAYVLRAGFLDGWPGYYIARLSAFSTLTRYAMVKEAALPPEQKEP
jgi:glycosyltransferase involved in cell wall biosynthesis